MALTSRRTLEDLVVRANENRFFSKLLTLRWKYFYRFFSRLSATDDVLFLNYGYEEHPPMTLPLEASDEPDRYPIQLYHRTATQADLRDKQVLEVSCGHGGGASYIMRTLHPASYTGLDLNTVGIAFCRERHDLPGLDFVQGDADDLPFADESFDAVINVEASHCYLDLDRFFAEVTRVLRSGGHFLYTDLRASNELAKWEAAIASAPLRLRSHRVINAEVMRGLERNRLLSQVTRHLPNISFLRRMAEDYLGGPGTLTYGRLENDKVSYRIYCFTKD